MKNICRDNKLREFYFKLLHRIVVIKRELFTYGIAENAICPYCKQNDPFSKSPIFGVNDDRKNQSLLAIVKKLNFTLLFAKYYLYITKLAPKIYLWMNLRLKSVGIMISKNPFLQLASKNPTYRNNRLINRFNVTVQIITTAVLFFFTFM